MRVPSCPYVNGVVTPCSVSLPSVVAHTQTSTSLYVLSWESYAVVPCTNVVNFRKSVPGVSSSMCYSGGWVGRIQLLYCLGVVKTLPASGACVGGEVDFQGHSQ